MLVVTDLQPTASWSELRTHGAVVVLGGPATRAEPPNFDQAGVSDVVAEAVYPWNLAGCRAGHAPVAGSRFTFGGLSDAAFRMIPLIEEGSRGPAASPAPGRGRPRCR